MYSPRSKLSTPQDFDFPHTPYAIQQQLMEKLYGILEEKKIGIFESPTGTGKSLTLSCAALRWLEDHEALVRKDLIERIRDVEGELRRLEADSAQSTDWIAMQFAANQEKNELRDLQHLKEKLDQHEQRLNELRQRRLVALKDRRRNQARKRIGENIEIEAKIDLDDELLEPVDGDKNKTSDTEDEFEDCSERFRDVQIFFCSRTHSQLAQVVREVKRSAYGRRIRCISLASRLQLCIHPQLKRLGNVALINERCLDMAKSGKREKSVVTSCDSNGCAQKKSRLTASSTLTAKCPFRDSQAVENLSEEALVNVLDIEELVGEGETLGACPFYAARSATRSAQMIMLPYQLLLHRRTRLQTGIDLRGSVVIIDEAHNLLDTIAQLHSCELSLGQLRAVQQQINDYKMRYSKRFSTPNLLKINQLLFVTKRLVKMLTVPVKGPGPIVTRMMRSYELMAEGEFFNIDLFQLLQFCERSRFAQKLQGFAQRPPQSQEVLRENQAPSTAKSLLQRLQLEHQQQQRPIKQKPREEQSKQSDEEKRKPSPLPYKTTSSSAIRPLLAFLEALTEDAQDGRVLVSIDSTGEPSRCSMKYVLLNPGGHFADIARDARAIIVAGGTMQPVTDLTEQLFTSCPERVEIHCYDHVVPSTAVMPFVVARGCTGRLMSFKYDQRGSTEMLTELSLVVQNLCNVVPSGVVCFLPSYDYLDAVFSHMQRSGALANISKRKQVFREARSNSSSGQTTEQLLADYVAAIRNPQADGGALLLSVVGGKLSEGLNFADDLGRAVIVVGMPYPSRHSPELQERMKYLDSSLGPGSGSEYYENLCMKAVNQCIGRSVRHIGDYACVFLLDERYTSEKIQKKLPKWISRSLQPPATSFGHIMATTAKFFRSKRGKENFCANES